MISSSDRRAALVGVSIIVSSLLMSLGVPWLRGWSQERQQVAMKATRDLAFMRRSIERRGETQQRLAALRALRRLHEDWLFAGGLPALETVAILRALTDAAEDEGVALSAVLPLAPTKGWKVRVARPVRARATFAGDLEAIAYFFAALEAGKPRIVIRQLALSQAETSLPRSRIEKLRGEMVVEGLAKADSSVIARQRVRP